MLCPQNGVCGSLCVCVHRRSQEFVFGGWQPRHPRCGDRDAEGVEEGRVWGAGVPSPADYGVWGSVVSSPSGVRDGAPAENEFWEYLELEKYT